MKSKNIKVAYTTRFQKKSILTVPKIQIEGKWLEELGFSVGSTVKVEYEDGSICIRPLTAEEQTLHNQQLLQTELKRRAAELNLLGKEYEHLSKVAEATNVYGASSDSKS